MGASPLVHTGDVNGSEVKMKGKGQGKGKVTERAKRKQEQIGDHASPQNGLRPQHPQTVRIWVAGRRKTTGKVLATRKAHMWRRIEDFKRTANRGPRLTPEGLRPRHPRRGGSRGQRRATRDQGGNERASMRPLFPSSNYTESFPYKGLPLACMHECD
jgi:hypothetical protein